MVFHLSCVSGATFSLRSLLVVVVCPPVIHVDPNPGPLTYLLALSDLPGFVTRGFFGNHRTGVGPDSPHQTCSIFDFGVLWDCALVSKDGDLPGLCSPSAAASFACVE